MKFTTTFRPPYYKPSFQEAFSEFPRSSLGILTTLLSLDPSYRGTAASALQFEVSMKKSTMDTTRKLILTEELKTLSIIVKTIIWNWAPLIAQFEGKINNLCFGCSSLVQVHCHVTSQVYQ